MKNINAKERISNNKGIDISKCLSCQYYYGELICAAFPTGIPNKIYNNEINHDKILYNQTNEIIYKKK